MPEISWTQMRHLEQFFVEGIHDHPQNPIVISHGDSWFAYPVYANIIDQLDEFVAHAMSLLRLENSGDLLIDILDAHGVTTLKNLMARYHPDVLLLSAGGNDIVGHQLLNFIAPRTDPFDVNAALATAALTARFDAMRAAYTSLLDARDQVAPRCQVVTHGYAHALPSGLPVHYIGFTAGPWIKPFLEAQGYVDYAEQRAIVNALIGRFNILVDSFVGRQVVKADVSTVITDSDWSNELHPTRYGFESAAKVLHSTLHQLMPTKFP